MATPAPVNADSIDAALRDARLFRGGRAMAEPRAGLPTGLGALDTALPWGGFPRGALSELLHAADGIGELTLLLPALRQLMQRERVALIAPPYLPYAPALVQAGLPLAQLAWIVPSVERTLWAAEQCLRAGCLGGVLLWSPSGDDRALRRLQLAAEQGDAHAWLLRPLKHAANASPAALRLRVERGRVEVLKCRGAMLRGEFSREQPACGQPALSPAVLSPAVLSPAVLSPAVLSAAACVEPAITPAADTSDPIRSRPPRLVAVR